MGCGGAGLDKLNNAGGDIQMFPGQTNNKGEQSKYSLSSICVFNTPCTEA